MHSETEIKLPVSDLAQAHNQAVSLGAHPAKKRHFEDNFLFDDASQTLRNGRSLLRVRVLNDSGLLTFKGIPELVEGIKKREELECEISRPETMIQILAQLGLFTTFRYQKYRSVYQIEGVQLDICIDETPIGNFFELEGEIARIHEYALLLGYSREQYISESYVSLYFQWCREKGTTPSQMVFQDQST